MAASNKPKKPKGKGYRSLSHVELGHETAEEVLILREYGDGENISKQSVLALKKAFEDISEKYRKSQTENKVLREKIEMGFKAFDDKYKETEQLRKELDLKEKEMTDKSTDTTTHQDISEEPESSSSLEMNTEISHILEKDPDKSFKSISTQTYEEKTDEVAFPYRDYKDLLSACGLELVLQNDKVILMLTNRDNLKQWLENETDGKVSVAFEPTPVCERFIQTDDTTPDVTSRINEQEAMIIGLRTKVYDQADVISKYRQYVEHLMQLQKSETPEAIKVTSDVATKKIIHLFKEYHQTVLTRSQVAVNHIESLKKELDFQQNYCKHLLQIIKGTQAQEPFFLSVPAPQQKLREIENVLEASSDESRIGEGASHIERVDDNASNVRLSMPVQVSDTQSQEGDTSASVVTLPESRSSSSKKTARSSNRSSKERSSATSSEVEETTAAAANPSKTRSAGSDRPVPTPRSRLRDQSLSLPDRNTDMQGVEVSSQDDDIEVINEDDERAIGGASRIDIRAKECPVCFISFSPSSSQEQFEAHVAGHFHD